MISKNRLLVAIATEIADNTGVDNESAIKAAHAAFKCIGLNVMLPLIEAMDFDTRPAYREIVINQVRDLLSEAPEVPRMDDPKAEMQVSDE